MCQNVTLGDSILGFLTSLAYGYPGWRKGRIVGGGVGSGTPGGGRIGCGTLDGGRIGSGTPGGGMVCSGTIGYNQCDKEKCHFEEFNLII